MGKELLHHELWELLSPGEAAPSQIPEGRSHRQTPGGAWTSREVPDHQNQ